MGGGLGPGWTWTRQGLSHQLLSAGLGLNAAEEAREWRRGRHPPRPGVFGLGGLSLLGPRSPLPENGPDDPCFASRGNDRTLPSRRWRCRPGDEVTCRATGLAGRDPRISLALHWVLGPHPELGGPYAQQEGRAPGSISTLLAQRGQTRSLSPHSLPAVSPSQLPAVGLIPLFLYF